MLLEHERDRRPPNETAEAHCRAYAGYPSQSVRYASINGLPGFVTVELDGSMQTTALMIEDAKIRGIYATRNPDKLRHVH